jgi:hypothetical protein
LIKSFLQTVVRKPMKVQLSLRVNGVRSTKIQHMKLLLLIIVFMVEQLPQ